jgi:Rrf2 family protein
MVEIASDISGNGVYQKDIAEKQQISLKYLDQIIHALKTAGLIAGVRGKKSGYILTRPASQITMFDIHRAFEPGICVVDCMSNGYQCMMMDECHVRGFWGDLNNLVLDYFKRVTLEDLVENRHLHAL